MPDTGQNIVLTRDQIEQYLDHLRESGRRSGTIQTYRQSLEHLYDFLPKAKRVESGTLSRWQKALLDTGYRPRTINTWLSIAGKFLEFLEYPFFIMPKFLLLEPAGQPELTRWEYIRLLQTARNLEKERGYLYVKLFGQTELSVQELDKLTAETVEAGEVRISSGGRKVVRLPSCLREELLAYMKRRGIRSGPVFLTRAGTPVSRTNVTDSIRRLCRDAQVEPEKGNPRCLRKLCLETKQSIQASLLTLMEQTYERLLETEQQFVGWDSGQTAQKMSGGEAYAMGERAP